LIGVVTKEKGHSLEPNKDSNSKNVLLQKLAAAETAIWSPQADRAVVQALSDLLAAAKETSNA